ncbi:MAG: T9SS type A sorting domain-containing protein, partial [Saprospiraceae bacterium]|nr:T9SS type A sorting domain-containing protein [Saprospiraceae bacterium]
GKAISKYKYSQLPIELGPFPGDCKTEYYFTVHDCENERCGAKAVLGKVCCETHGEDCLLSDLKMEKTDCNDHKEFYLYFNFNYKNTSDCFNVEGNGVNYGKFKYADLPIKIGPLKGNCETEYEFVFSDCENEKCHLVKKLGKVCCETQGEDCLIKELSVTRGDCNEEKQFYVKLNFEYKNVSECFVVYQNGKAISKYKYSQLPIELGPFPGDCKTEYYFTVHDCENERCGAKVVLGKVCCETHGEDCLLSDLKMEKTDCNDHKEFYLYFNFNHKNTSDCFKIHGNGVDYGKYKYADLPIKIGPLKGNCETDYEFVFSDCENEKCHLVKELGKVCCETQGEDCIIKELSVSRSDCNEEKQFYVKLNFEYKNVSECFVVYQNGKAISKYKYSQLPIELGPFTGDCKTEYYFTVHDCENERCGAKAFLGKVCCDTHGEDCLLSDLKMEKTDCNDNKEFYLYFNFSHKNTSDCFNVEGNGVNYGKYKYTDLPIKIGPLKGNCETEYEFIFSDCENEKCHLVKKLGKVCCETQGEDCLIKELSVSRSDCNEEKQFYVKLNFEYKNVSECFVVYQNGKAISKYKYSQLPIELGPFTGDCKTEYYFTVTDCENERCGAKAFLGKVCCETQGEDCKLSELKMEKTECNSNKEFYLIFNFHYKNTSDCFNVHGNGVSYGKYKYADLPIKIGPLKGNCETEYEFVFSDCENEKCQLVKELGKVCCETQNKCELGALEISKSDCNADGLFDIKLNFKYANVSECFIVKQNNNIIGKFKYSQLPLKLGSFKADCITNYVFTVSDCVSEKCFVSKEIGKVCCKPFSGSCYMSDLKYEKTSCNEKKEVYLVLKFLYNNTSECFTVTSNGVSLGTYNYKDLPVKVGPFKADCKTKYNLVIRDCKSERCGIEASIGTLCCDKLGAECKISDLEAKALDCTGISQYSVQINFNHTGTQGLGFDVFDAHGKSIGFYSYASLPLTLKEYKAGGSEYDYIKVCDNDNEKCCAELEFKALKCLKGSTGTFKINNVEVRYMNTDIVLYSDVNFPGKFEYFISDINGREIHTQELYRENNRIIISTQGILNGVYVVKMQNSFELRNLKFVK